jgi:membrane-bound serine protease (ClpP class)
MMGAVWFVLLLQLLAVVVIIAEFMLPSAGVLTVAALGLVGYSLYQAFTTISTGAGWVVVMLDILLMPLVLMVGVKLLARSPATLRTTLARSAGGEPEEQRMAALVDKQGQAVTDLRPSGKALIENVRVDVITRGEYIEAGSAVVVIRTEGNRVLVKKHTN